MKKIAKTSLVKDVKIGKNVAIWNFCNLYGCELGDNVSIGSYTEIRKGVKIGAGSRIQANVFIPEGITIGKNVFIGPGVIFTNDKYPIIDADFTPIETIVEDDVAIGAGAVITPGITIGKGAMIGAGAVVTKDIKPGIVAYGNPAREKGKRKNNKEIKENSS